MMSSASPAELGFWLETANAPACEMAAAIGYRIVVFDMEHGVFGAESADRLITLCRALGLKVHVRVAAAERVPIQQALDAGADAIILPQIANLEHAVAAAGYTKFPPLGTRGLGYSRTMGYTAPVGSFPEEENQARRCYVMIETPGALADAEAIADLPCVDGLFVGPGDLSLTRGRGINRWCEGDRQDVETVARAAQTAGKTWAFPTGNPDIFAFAVPLNPEFIVIADDLSALYAGLQGTIHSVRDAVVDPVRRRSAV